MPYHPDFPLARSLDAMARRLLIDKARRERIARTYTAQGLRKAWTDYKRNSVQPHIAFERFLNLYWEIRSDCH